MIPQITVSLAEPPLTRWRLLDRQTDWARRLIRMSVDEIGGVDLYREHLQTYSSACVAEEFADEIRGLADLTGADFIEALAANLYYDFIIPKSE